MKLSQNPNGIVEAYTDEGIYIGNVLTQGDFFGYDDTEERLGTNRKPDKKKDRKTDK